jgi:AcrR family transcriptional regulator
VSQAAEDRAPRGEQTRARIGAAALRLFRDQGYEATTMRAVAAEAGVSLGNAYYYFASKEHLVQSFYDEMQRLHHAAATGVLATETDFAARLRGVLLAWVDAAAPYHAFAGKFFKFAAEPTSPLSPFSAESAPAREASIDIYREVASGTKLRLPDDVAAELPYLLWLYQMGITLYWVHDRSEDTQRTRLLVERTVPLVARLVALSRSRVLRPLTRDVLALVRELRG